MVTLEKIRRKITSKSRFQDVIFIIGIFAFSIIIVLGLFPKTDPEESASRISFIYLTMVIPIIVAIYFIIISFKRQLYSESSEISSSITFKIALAFVFVAILSSIPTILVSNNLINHTIAQLINEKTINALEESVNMSYDSIHDSYKDIEGELKSLNFSIKKGTINIHSIKDRQYLSNMFMLKGFHTIFYRVLEKNFYNNIAKLNGGNFNKDHSSGITKFLQNTTLTQGHSVNNISIDKSPILIGNLYHRGYLIVLYKEIPEIVFERIALYKESLERYESQDILKPYFQMGVGIVLLIMAILIILLSISLGFFLSRNITRPVLELVDAAGNVASGNFNIHLNRDSSDELTLLFSSFNQMVKQLNDSRKMMYQTQKLEAWREVAQKLLHEIKNPLTPIRLSAERIRKRFNENEGDVENVILSGTETIIEEVKVLTMMLSEFSSFARLPEMKGEFQNISPIIENCVNFFHGHEGISFQLNLDNSIPVLFIDKILIRQALTNILQNSIEAIGQDGIISIKSELTSSQDKKIVRLTIKDDGNGIKEEDIGKVFEPTFSTKERGTGIGLAIVNKIILEHNGEIVCNSDYGEGTEFIIDLPIHDEEVNPGG